jgi:hypothetical protein
MASTAATNFQRTSGHLPLREDVELVSYKFDYKGRATLQAKGYYALLTGTVRNNSEKTFASVRLKFDVCDDAGKRLGTVTPYSRVGPPAITSLDPGETWSFSFEISGYGGRGRSAKFLGMEATE